MTSIPDKCEIHAGYCPILSIKVIGRACISCAFLEWADRSNGD